jgi:hypothetical protein
MKTRRSIKPHRFHVSPAVARALPMTNTILVDPRSPNMRGDIIVGICACSVSNRYRVTPVGSKILRSTPRFLRYFLYPSVNSLWTEGVVRKEIIIITLCFSCRTYFTLPVVRSNNVLTHHHSTSSSSIRSPLTLVALRIWPL